MSVSWSTTHWPHHCGNDSSGSIDPCQCRGQPHTGHIIAKIDKVKDVALIILKVSLDHQNVILCQETSRVSAWLHAYSHPFSELFVFNYKSHSFKTLLLLCAKNIFKNSQVTFRLESAFPQLYCQNFRSYSLLLVGVLQEKNRGFFCKHTV